MSDAEALYKPTNITTIINRVSKSPHQELVSPIYEMLCEVAHPNFLGRSLYLLGAKEGSREGDEVRTIGLGEGPMAPVIVEATVAGVSWACGTQATAFKLMSDTVRAVKERVAIA